MTVAKLLEAQDIEHLALPSNLRYGEAIFRRGGVEIITFEDQVIEAWIGGLDGTVSEGTGQRRRTQLRATPRGLSWQCAGNPKNHQIFCKHCVALALAIKEKNGYGS